MGNMLFLFGFSYLSTKNSIKYFTKVGITEDSIDFEKFSL